MKKILLLIASVLLLTGCQDAQANISNSSEKIIKIKDTYITKGEIYNGLLYNFGSYIVYSDISEKILDSEIETTQEIIDSANEQLETNKSLFPDLWEDTLIRYGFKDEEDYVNSIILNLRKIELIKKYIGENWDSIITKYNPKKAVILSFNESDKANAALVELKNGVDPQEVATAYGSFSKTGVSEIVTSYTDYPSDVKAIINTASVNDDYVMIPSADGVTTYIIKILETDPLNIKDEVIDYLSKDNTIADESLIHYLNKYKFTIYDRSLYEKMKIDFPNYVVQK